jgi:hypothetical protein
MRMDRVPSDSGSGKPVFLVPLNSAWGGSCTFAACIVL